MSVNHPIIWTEGALLSQQHFQYWESWLLAQQSRWINALVPDASGLVACEWDLEALTAQKCALKSLVWRSETGRWLVYESKTMPVVATRLEDCAEQWVYLNLPNNQLCSGLSGYQSGSNLSTYKAEYLEWADRYDSARRQEITLGRPELVLTTQPLDPQSYDSWPLVKIKQVLNSRFEIDDEFIPCCLTLSGSGSLQNQLNSLIPHLSEKSIFLKSMVRGMQDPLLTQEYLIVSQALLELKIILAKGTSQPRDIHQMLVKTCLGLSILSGSDFHPAPYQHESSGDLIKEASTQLIALLNQKVETLQTYLLTKNHQYFFCVENLDPEYLQGYHWYLGIDFSNHPQDLIAKLISPAKLGTKATLEQMIASALPGIPFTHVTRPPNRIKLGEGYEYFKLDHESVYWKHVKEERNLMLYLPSFLDGKKITLDLVKE
jgi:type VI secretion system protein ImpJ